MEIYGSQRDDEDEEFYNINEESYDKNENFVCVEEIFIEDENFEKKLLRKIDFRIIPLLSLLYLLSFLDRINIGNAKLAGLEQDIGLVGTQFNWCLGIFFIGYILFEIPSNIVLIKTNPSIWIPFIMISWGIVTTIMAFAKDFSCLMMTRFFLGVFESGLFPGAIYYITTWYKRSETNTRIGIIFIGNSFAGCLSGLISYGIVRLNGILGLSGWQWIFLIEGIVTLVISVLAFFFLSNYPEKSVWLSEEERKYAVGRLKHDAGKAHVTQFHNKQIYAALTDWKVYLVMLYMCTICVTFSSFMYFIPTIVNGMGFEYVRSQLLSVPPFICSGISIITIAILSDRKRSRGPFIIACSFIAMIGYILLIIPSLGIAGKYVGACIIGVGVSPASVTSITWLTNNIAGNAKRGIATAMILTCANIGGALGSQVYRPNDFPNYFVGHSIAFTFLTIATCIAIFQYFAFKTLNKRKKENPQSFLEGKTEEEIRNLGDLHPDFVYSL